MEISDFKQKPSGVPILSKNDIEEFAENVLSRFNPELLLVPQPVTIELLIETHLGLDVDYKNLSIDESILGLTTFDDGFVKVYTDNSKEENLPVNEGTIIIDNKLLEGNPGRLRFTYAHEASHWILHRHIFQSNSNQMTLFEEEQEAKNIRCLTRNVETIFANTGNRILTDDDWLEWQADSLGASLLLPKPTFKLAFNEKLESYGIKHCPLLMNKKGEDIYFLVVNELSRMFDVSKQAVQVRLSKLKLKAEWL